MRRNPVPGVIRRSYAAKMIAAFAVILLLVGGISAFIYADTSRALSEEAQVELRDAAETRAVQLEQWTTNSRQSAQMVSESRAIADGDPTAAGSYLDSLFTNRRLTRGARAVHYINASTTEIVASSHDGRVGEVPRTEGVIWAQEALVDVPADDTRMTTYEPPGNDAMLVAFVTGVPEQERAIVYVASMTGAATRLDQRSGAGYTVVVDGEGETLINQHTPSAVGEQHSPGAGVDSPAVAAGLDGESGYRTVDAEASPDDLGRLAMGYAPTAGTDWVVLTPEPTSSVFALRQSISRNLGGLFGTMVLGFVLVGVTLGRNTVSALDRLTSKADAMESGTLDIDFETDRADEFGELFAAFGSMRDSLRARIEAAEEARAAADAEREQSEQLVEHLESKAAAYQRVMEATAEGDLTRRMDPSGESEAMGRIADSFNRMVDDLAATIARIDEFAAEVAESSETVTTSAAEVQAASREVSESVQGIAAGADAQSESLDEVSAEMQSLSGTIEEVAASTEQVAATAERAASQGRGGRESAQRALAELDDIEATTRETAAAVEALATDIEEITDVVDLITEIAAQTDTLALNASIEAARADGGAGGFEVVADEVKTLAEEAADATEEIETRIDRIQSSATTTVDDIRTMRTRVEDGTETVEDALTALEDVVERVEAANQGIQEISDTTDEQAGSAEAVVTITEDVAGVAEENAAEARQVSTAADEQTTALTEVSTSARTLADRATELQEVLAAFELEEGTDSTAASGSGVAADGGTARGSERHG